MILNNINCDSNTFNNIINSFISSIFKFDDDSKDSEDYDEPPKINIPTELWNYFEDKYKSKNSYKSNNLDQEEPKIMIKCYYTIKLYIISILNELNTDDFWKKSINKIVYITKHKKDDNSKLLKLLNEYEIEHSSLTVEIKHRFHNDILMTYVNQI